MPKAAKPAPKNGNAGSALTRALRFEKTGMRYFTLSAQKATDGFAKRVFALLADMERKHYEDILAIAKKLEETGKFPVVSAVSSEGRMRLFKREYSRIKKEKTITGDAAIGDAEGPRVRGRGAGDVHPHVRKLLEPAGEGVLQDPRLRGAEAFRHRLRIPRFP